MLQQLNRFVFEVDSLYEKGFFDQRIKNSPWIFPKEIVTNSKYRQLHSIDILLYSLILSMTHIFESLNFFDQEGKVYTEIPNDFLKNLLKINSTGALNSAKKRLIDTGLIYVKETGRSNHYYTRHYNELRKAVS